MYVSRARSPSLYCEPTVIQNVDNITVQVPQYPPKRPGGFHRNLFFLSYTRFVLDLWAAAAKHTCSAGINTANFFPILPSHGVSTLAVPQAPVYTNFLTCRQGIKRDARSFPPQKEKTPRFAAPSSMQQPSSSCRSRTCSLDFAYRDHDWCIAHCYAYLPAALFAEVLFAPRVRDFPSCVFPLSLFTLISYLVPLKLPQSAN